MHVCLSVPLSAFHSIYVRISVCIYACIHTFVYVCQYVPLSTSWKALKIEITQLIIKVIRLYKEVGGSPDEVEAVKRIYQPCKWKLCFLSETNLLHLSAHAFD